MVHAAKYAAGPARVPTRSSRLWHPMRLVSRASVQKLAYGNHLIGPELQFPRPLTDHASLANCLLSNCANVTIVDSGHSSNQ
jgi:hypothetical protein